MEMGASAHEKDVALVTWETSVCLGKAGLRGSMSAVIFILLQQLVVDLLG